jgi:ABC-2 type transport system permease protein
MWIRDWRAPLVCGFLAVALVFTTLYGVRDYRYWRSSSTTTAEAEYTRWINQGNKSSHSAAHFGQFVFPARLPLSALENGTVPYAGAFVFLEAHTQKLPQFRPAEDRSFLFRFVNADAGFILEALVPLAIVLLLFGAVAGERENGTLQQLLASGISLRTVAAGKMLAAALALSVVIIPYFLFAGSWIFSQSERPSDDAARLVIAIAAWGACWAGLAAFVVLVSALARSAKQALLWLLPAWIALCFVAPPAAAWLSGVFFPSMDGLTFAAAIQSDRYTLPVWYERLDATEKRLLAKYSATDLKALPVSPAGIAMVEDEEAYDRLQERRFAELYGVWEGQSDSYGLMGLPAPPLAASSVAMAMAGTDIPHSRHFAAAAERYRQYLVQAMNAAMISGQRPDALPYVPGYTPGAELWRTIRKFEYDPPPVSWAFDQAIVSALCLLAWNVAAFTLLYGGLKKAQLQ